MTFAQDGFLSFLENAFKFLKDLDEVSTVKRMNPEELQQWRAKEVTKLHTEAVKLGSMSDKELAKRGLTREDEMDKIRVFEVLLRGRRGMGMNQNLLEGMDVRGLDLSKVVPGHILQEHINQALGDENTKLPSDLKVPVAWQKQPDPSPSKSWDPNRPFETSWERDLFRSMRLDGK